MTDIITDNNNILRQFSSWAGIAPASVDKKGVKSVSILL